jgi:probable HAF family extracellular repeat protein
MRHPAARLVAALTLVACAETTGPASSAYEAVVITADRGFPLGEAFAINDSGEVVGALLVDRSVFGAHAFSWRDDQLQDLGPPGSLGAAPAAINNHGDFVGSAFFAMNEPAHVFISNGIQFTDLGFPGEARAINNLGDVVGIRTDSAYQQAAFRWRAGSPPAPVDPGNLMTEANDISEAGVVVGMAPLPGCPYACAAMWTGTALVALPLEPYSDPQVFLGFPLSVNAAGVVVGWGMSPSGDRAIRWQGAMEVLPGLAGGPSHAIQIADNGDIVGGSTDQSGVYRPVLWRNGELIVLPIPAGYTAAQARGINARGEIVGIAASRPSVYQVVVWRPTSLVQ